MQSIFPEWFLNKYNKIYSSVVEKIQPKVDKKKLFWDYILAPPPPDSEDGLMKIHDNNIVALLTKFITSPRRSKSGSFFSRCFINEEEHVFCFFDDEKNIKVGEDYFVIAKDLGQRMFMDRIIRRIRAIHIISKNEIEQLTNELLDKLKNIALDMKSQNKEEMTKDEFISLLRERIGITDVTNFALLKTVVLVDGEKVRFL